MFMLKTMKQELMADTRSKIGAALAKPALRRLKHTLDYTEVGGAPLLGSARRSRQGARFKQRARILLRH